METIHKYQLKIQDNQWIDLPFDYEILSIQNQNGVLTMWVKVNPNNSPEPALIAIYGTGNPIKGVDQSYIDTVQMDGLVWHIFLVH